MTRLRSGAFFLVVALAHAGVVLGQEASYKVIVGSTNAIGSVSRAFLGRIFLKQVATWPNGQAVVPVDQAEGTTVREGFSTEVLGRSVTAVKSYWQRQIFTGAAVPPVEKESDAAVISFVRNNNGAVGYVGAAAQLPATVKVLRVTE